MSEDVHRLDVAVLNLYPNHSRSLVQKLIKNGYVSVNGEIITKTGTMVSGRQRIDIDISILKDPTDQLNLDILYEDENCAVIVKPVGVLTHSKGAYNPEPTVLSWLKEREHYTFSRDDTRGGVVHRLDRATSGVLICAKNKKTLGVLQKQFQLRTTKKIYAAVVAGIPVPSKVILDLPIERNPKKPQTFRVGINGKASQTTYEVISSGETSSLLRLYPLTGRTHQLRVHMAYIKHPIVGDNLYAGKPADRLYLHAEQLEITLPGGIRKNFTAKIPKDFDDYLKKSK